MQKSTKILLPILSCSLLFLAGCSRSIYYYMQMSQVERPDKITQILHEAPIFITSKITGENTYEDNFIKINWYPTLKHFEFTLKNKTDKNIKIIWDNAVYTDHDNISHRIIHSGIKFRENNNSQIPTTIIKNTSVKDLIYPADKVYFTNNGWQEENILPLKIQEDKFESFKSYLINKEVKILLPIEIDNQIKEYLFIFKITDLKLKPINEVYKDNQY